MKNIDFEHRLLMRDVSVKYVRAMGRPSTNGESGELEFVGAVTEITQRKHVEEALRRSEQQLREVIETIPAMAWTTDPNGSRDFANHRIIRADVRVIAATNRDLQLAIASGAFRSDLFYRLNVIPMEVPSLRQRKEDIPMLIEYFIDRYSRKAGKRIKTIEKKTLELLRSY